MPETHQVHDSWYEIWFGDENARKHLKRLDESEMVAEVTQLREADSANIEVTKVTVNRETLDDVAADVAVKDVPVSNGEDAHVDAPTVVTPPGTPLK